jgi:hypothetical protein
MITRSEMSARLATLLGLAIGVAIAISSPPDESYAATAGEPMQETQNDSADASHLLITHLLYGTTTQTGPSDVVAAMYRF